MSDVLADLLRDLSDAFECVGGQGRIGLTLDVPIILVTGGHKFRSTMQIRWTEDGPELPDPDGQARRIAREMGI